MGVSTSQTGTDCLTVQLVVQAFEAAVLEKIWSISFSLSLRLFRLLTSSCSSFTWRHRSLISAHLLWARKPISAASALARSHRHYLQPWTYRAVSFWSSLWVKASDVTEIVGPAVAGDCALRCITTIAEDLDAVLSRVAGPFSMNCSTNCSVCWLLLLTALVLAYILKMYMWGQTGKHYHREQLGREQQTPLPSQHSAAKYLSLLSTQCFLECQHTENAMEQLATRQQQRCHLPRSTIEEFCPASQGDRTDCNKPQEKATDQQVTEEQNLKLLENCMVVLLLRDVMGSLCHDYTPTSKRGQGRTLAHRLPTSHRR